MRNNLKAYQSVNVASTLATADPHQIITMMYNGLLESLAQAKGAIERRDLESKSKLMVKSTSILQALQGALDSDSEPEISKNFNELYGYCIDKINDANITLDTSSIDQVINFLMPIRDAWQQMPEESKQEGFELLKQKEQKANESTKAIGA
jgi:flagellar protein FliS